MQQPFRVPFVTVEDGDDLIVSFALDDEASDSLTLIRTPKYEFILDDGERGVSLGESEEGVRELLLSVEWGKDIVLVRSTAREYRLDLSRVDAAEVKDAKAVLRKMNFDGRFEIT